MQIYHWVWINVENEAGGKKKYIYIYLVQATEIRLKRMNDWSKIPVLRELKHVTNLETTSYKSCGQHLMLTIRESHFQPCQLRYRSYTEPSIPRRREQTLTGCFPKSVIQPFRYSQTFWGLFNLQPTCQPFLVTTLESLWESLISQLLLMFLPGWTPLCAPRCFFLPSCWYCLSLCWGTC